MLPGIGSSMLAGGSRLKPVLTFQSNVRSTQTSGRTFDSTSSTSFGSLVTGGDKRFILCLIHSIWGFGELLDGWADTCEIGGIGATKLFRLPSAYGSQTTDCFYIEDNTLTSGDLQVVWNGTGSQFTRTVFGIYTLVNPQSIEPVIVTNAASALSVSVSTTRSSEQVGLAMASPNNDSGGTISWLNATVNYNQLGNSNTYYSGALIDTATGTFDVTATQGASGNIMRVTSAVWS